MTVSTFPITWPTTAFLESNWEPLRRQAMGVTGGARDIAVDFGQPAWTATLKTIPLTLAQAQAWKAFKASLRGQARFFLGWDPTREYPGAYMPAGWGALTRAGGGSFDGTCGVTAIATSGLDSVGRDVITLGSPALPVGFSLVAGDMIGFVQSGKYTLHRVLDAAPVAANGSGVSTIWIEPELPASFTTAAVAHLYRPCAKMRVTALDVPISAAGRNRPGQATITAVSTML